MKLIICTSIANNIYIIICLCVSKDDDIQLMVCIFMNNS